MHKAFAVTFVMVILLLQPCGVHRYRAGDPGRAGRRG